MKDIAYIRHAGIDKNRWDAAIARSSNGMVYAHSWFLDLVSPRWDALIAGDYEMVMPLTWKKKAGIQYLCQPPFTQQLGVFSPKSLAHQQTAAFLRAIPSSFRYVDIFLNQRNPLDAADVKGKVISRLTHHLDLLAGFDRVLVFEDGRVAADGAPAETVRWYVDRMT